MACIVTPLLYVIDFKRALNFGEARALSETERVTIVAVVFEAKRTFKLHAV
jgi:hypothetical protein